MTGRRPKRSESAPSTGEKRNCIAAHTVANSPTYSAARAVLPCMKSSISFGSTGTIMPSASISRTTVMKMNARAARRGFSFIATLPVRRLLRSRLGRARGFSIRGRHHLRNGVGAPLGREVRHAGGLTHRRRHPPPKPLRRRHQIAIFQNRRDLVPFHFVIEAHADPSLRTHVRRYEKTLAIGLDQDFLHHRRRLHPYAEVAAAMMVAVGHREHAAAADPKRALAPRLLFEGFGKREADFAQPLQRGIGIVIVAGMRHFNFPRLRFAPPRGGCAAALRAPFG